ncbi:MAG: COG4705 family protein [Propionibacteriaceae bacterium]
MLVSIVGTQITDFFTDTLGVSLYISPVVFAVILAAVFTVWHRQEGTLAITSIDTRRRESFYWAAVLVTFALGTAAGDLATEALSLGFRNGVLVFGGLIAVTYLANRFGANAVLTFWVADVLTRPLGASLGDLLTQQQSFGGLGLGASVTSVIFFTVIVTLVVREQRLVNRYGGAAKGAGPHGGRGKDYAWAGAGIGAVVVLSLGLGTRHGMTTPAAAAPTVTSTSGTTGSQFRPTTRLGDVSAFVTIADDVQTRVAQHDLVGAKVRVKDLEVAWDSAEAGLKPRDPADWKTLDGQIDGVLTSLRASNPSQADCAAYVRTLTSTLTTFNGG